VIASTLIGMKTPALRGRVLVRWATLFGISEGAARVALSRMVQANELDYAEGRYELAGRLRQRQETQQWSRHPHALAWDGAWSVYVVEEGRRDPAERQQLRAAMRDLRTAELRESVWMRPRNLPPEAHPAGALRIVAAQTLAFEARPADADAALAERLFDLSAWEAEARRHLEEMAGALPDLVNGKLDALAPSFLIGAGAISHIRTDPILPDELLPETWPGPELRARYEEYVEAFLAVWRDWYRNQQLALEA
jgi:phenylacetic acid degradation operon negative regulatory protein